MKVEQYNPSDMQLLDSDVTGVDFGNVVKGNHNDEAIVVKPVADMGMDFQILAMFLEDNAGLDHSQFGKYQNSTGVTGVTPGSNYLSDYFVETPGISDAADIGSVSDNGILFNAGAPEFAWLDVEVGSSETVLGQSSVNYRFVFEYV